MKANDTPSTLGDYIGVLRRRRIFLLTVIPAALLLAVYLAYALPPQYRSSATIMLETASISADLVRTTVSSYADEQFELVQRRVLTSENLEPLVKEFDPYPDMPELTAKDKAKKIIEDTLIERVDPVTFEVLQESNAFSIHYHNADPARAKDIAQRISNLFLDFNRVARNERATSAYDFLLSQAQEVERRISEVDLKVAQFKARHGDALPEAQVRNLGAAERSSQPVFSRVITDRAQGQQMVVVFIPLGDKGGNPGGVAGYFRLGASTGSVLNRSVEKLRREEHSNAYLVDATGRVIYHSQPEHIGTSFAAQETVQKLLAGMSGAYRTRDTAGREIVASFAPVPGTSWGLVIEEDWASLISSSRRYGQLLLLLLGLGILVPGGLDADADGHAVTDAAPHHKRAPREHRHETGQPRHPPGRASARREHVARAVGVDRDREDVDVDEDSGSLDDLDDLAPDRQHRVVGVLGPGPTVRRGRVTGGVGPPPARWGAGAVPHVIEGAVPDDRPRVDPRGVPGALPHEHRVIWVLGPGHPIRRGGVADVGLVHGQTSGVPHVVHRPVEDDLRVVDHTRIPLSRCADLEHWVALVLGPLLGLALSRARRQQNGDGYAEWPQ